MRHTIGPIEPTGPHRRAYEQTWWGKLYVHYKLFTPIISGAVLLILMFGFQFQTPAQWFQRLERRIVAVEVRTTSLEQRNVASDIQSAVERQQLSDKMDVVVRWTCGQMTPRERSITPVCDQVGTQ